MNKIILKSIESRSIHWYKCEMIHFVQRLNDLGGFVEFRKHIFFESTRNFYLASRTFFNLSWMRRTSIPRSSNLRQGVFSCLVKGIETRDHWKQRNNTIPSRRFSGGKCNPWFWTPYKKGVMFSKTSSTKRHESLQKPGTPVQSMFSPWYLVTWCFYNFWNNTIRLTEKANESGAWGSHINLIDKYHMQWPWLACIQINIIHLYMYIIISII